MGSNGLGGHARIRGGGGWAGSGPQRKITRYRPMGRSRSKPISPLTKFPGSTHGGGGGGGEGNLFHWNALEQIA